MVTIKSYEIAKLFGLQCRGLEELLCNPAVYVFEFHSTYISVIEGSGDDEAVDEDEAKEEAAKRVLFEIGKRVALYI